MLGAEEVHNTSAVISFVLPSEYLAVALNCWVKPSANDAGDGDIEIEEREGVTVSPVLEEIPDLLAPIVVVPAATAVTSPEELMVAALVLDELHFTEAVMF